MSFTDRILVVLDSTSAGAVKEMDRLQRSTKEADKGVSALGKTMKGALVAGAAAFAGAGLVSFLNTSVTAYSEAAKKAGELAKATGGSVENVSRMTAALQDNGVSAEQTAALLSKFTATVGKNDALLGKYGVTLKKNADGSADYADAMVQVIDNIAKIGDASKRQAALTEVFGKKQAAVFQELAASGVSLSDAMQAVSKYRVFDSEDVARAVQYDDAMDKLGGSVQGLQFALGEALVPALSATADVLAEVVEFMSGIPVEVYAAVGGFVALKGAMSFFGPALSSAVSDVALAMTGLGAVKPGELAKGIVSAIGPANLALAGLAGAFIAVSLAQDNFEQSVRDAVPRLKELEDAGATSAQAIKQVASEIEANSNVFENFWAALAGDSRGGGGSWKDWLVVIPLLGGYLGDLIDAFTEGGDDAQAYENELRKVADEMGALAAATADAEVKQRSLNDILAEGGATAEQIAAAASEAAAAQSAANAVTEAAAVAMGLYAVSIQGVVDWQSRLATGAADAQSALGSLQDTLGRVGAVMDDPETWENEVVLNTAQAEADLYRYVGILANSGLTAEQIIPLLIDLQNRDGTSAEADAVVQGVIDAITGKSNEVPPLLVGTALDPNSQANTQAGIDGLTAPKTTAITVTTEYPGGGYEGAKARADYLSQERKGSIAIDVRFSPDGYNAIKARVDYLAQNRTATITQVVNQVTGTRVAGVEQQSIGGGVNAAAMFSPINMVRVSLDGRELRSVIDDEIRALTPARQEVA
jgi:uncharacterized protein YoaH (UPF0181 family)